MQTTNIIEPPTGHLIGAITQAGFGTSEIIYLVILIVLIILSALISGSEAAFFSLSPNDKEELKSTEGKKAESVSNMINKPKDLLATILIANNFVNVGIVIFSSAFITKLLDGINISESVQFLIEIVAITLVLLLFGEVIPKIYATKNALRFSLLMGNPIAKINKIPPISWMRLGLVKGSKYIQSKVKKGKANVHSDDLEQALILTKELHENTEEHKILEGIVKFGNTEVRQIMKPRMDVHGIEISTNFKEVLEIILESGHSRIPVFEETFDQIKGILFIKDLLPFLGENQDDTNWTELIRPPFFVPENKKIDDLLKEFQEKKVHMAMVVDEYGGTNGIVTLEDILEEIVGDITDEFDEDEVIYTKIDDNTYLFEGKTALIDFLKVMDLQEAEEFDSKLSETLGGFMTEKAGKILMNNEFVEVGNLKMLVEASDKKRIKMIKIIKNEGV